MQRGSILVVRKEGSSVNCKIVEYSSKVLASCVVRRYTLSKGSAKGPQGVRNAYCNRSGSYLFCFGSQGASSS